VVATARRGTAYSRAFEPWQRLDDAIAWLIVTAFIPRNFAEILAYISRIGVRLGR